MAEQQPGEETTGEDRVHKTQIEARARRISHNVRCTECGNQSIEDSQADIAVLLRKLIRDELKAGKSDKEVFDKLRDEYGESILYAPRFDMQTAGLWLLPVLTVGTAVGVSLYRRQTHKANLDLLADKMLSGIPLTASERQAIKCVVKPPEKRWWW